MGCRAKLGIESFRNRCSATAMVRSDSVIRTAAMTGISSPPHHDEMSRLRRLAVSHSLARHRHQCPLNQLGDQGFGEAALIHPFWHLLMHKGSAAKHNLLHLWPWQSPAVELLRSECPYPPHTAAFQWHPHAVLSSCTRRCAQALSAAQLHPVTIWSKM